MTIALFGGEGSIGRRYQAVLQSLRIPYRVIEAEDDGDMDGITRAIIATPTETHFSIILECFGQGIPFLCEKPLSKNEEDLKAISALKLKGFVVNNYSQLVKPNPLKEMHYDFYNTGRDGLLWDCCQIVYLAHLHQSSLMLRKKSPTWKFSMNHKRVAYEAIERSYIDMMKAFLEGDEDSLWSLKDGVEMSRLIFKLEASLKTEITNEGVFWDSKKLKLEPIMPEVEK